MFLTWYSKPRPQWVDIIIITQPLWKRKLYCGLRYLSYLGGVLPYAFQFLSFCLYVVLSWKCRPICCAVIFCCTILRYHGYVGNWSWQKCCLLIGYAKQYEPGSCFTNTWRVHDPNLVKICIVLGCTVMAWSGHNFAQCTAAELSWLAKLHPKLDNYIENQDMMNFCGIWIMSI